MILMYHNVVPDDAPPGVFFTRLTLRRSAFERQMRWLSRFLEIIPLAEYLERPQRFGSRTIAITFDDGTAITFESANPILEQYSIPATVFAVTGHLQDGELMWGSYLNALCFQGPYPAIESGGRVFSLASAAERRMTQQVLSAELRRSADPRQAARTLACAYPLPPEVTCYYQGMTGEQLAQAGNSDLIEVGSHTVTHPYLSRLTAEEQRRELLESRRSLEDCLLRPVRFLAYPSNDYSRLTLEQVRAAGYVAAFATVSRKLGSEPILELERTGIYSGSLLKLFAKTLGAGRIMSRLGRAPG